MPGTAQGTAVSPAAIPQGCEGSGARPQGSRVTCTLVQLASSRIARVSAAAPTGKELVEPVEGGESLESAEPPHSSVLLDTHDRSICTLRTSFHSPWTCLCVCVGRELSGSPGLVQDMGRGWGREQGAQGKGGLSLVAPCSSHEAGPQQIERYSIWAAINGAFFTGTKM